MVSTKLTGTVLPAGVEKRHTTPSNYGSQLLFPEAHQRERRRRLLAVAAAAIFLGGGVATGLVVTSTRPITRSASVDTVQRPTAVPAGIVVPKRPGALAVAPDGDLYVVDSGRDQILRHLPSGKFEVVAGTGQRGFSGDGGPATDAKIDLASDAGIAVSPSGAVYFADSGNYRVREILRDGLIETVAGGGTIALGANSVSARDALLAGKSSGPTAIGGLTFGPGGDLFVGLPAGVYRLSPAGVLIHVIGGPYARNDGSVYADPANAADFSPAYRLAFDRSGNLYVAGGGGFGLYVRLSSGALRFVEQFRGGGAGFWGSLTMDSDGTVVAVSNAGIQASTASGSMAPITSSRQQLASALDHALGSRDVFEGGVGIAAARNGTLYVDIDSGVWSRVSGILAVSPSDHVTAVWRG
jgi:sugar lactone lactonase YvrE